MKKSNNRGCSRVIFMVVVICFTSCSSRENNNSKQMRTEYRKGTYGFDAAFLTANHINYIELKDTGSKATVLIVPGFQGRVMTSSASGNEGASYGWINYSLIDS
jgi:hypothetical protein